MKNIKISFSLIFLIIGLILFSGCGVSEEDCEKKSSTYIKYGYDDNLGKCVIVDKIPKDKCGNGVKEFGETYCNCPKDVKKTDPEVGCDGDVGEYISKSCNEKTKECGLYKNKKVINEEKQLVFKNTDLEIYTYLTIDNPYVLNTDDENNFITLKIELYNKKEDTNIRIEDINVERFEIKNSKNTVLGSLNINKKLNNVGNSIGPFEIKLAQTTAYQSKKSLKTQLIVSYKKLVYDRDGNLVKSEDKKQTLTSSLGTWTFINPNFYEEKKKRYS